MRHGYDVAIGEEERVLDVCVDDALEIPAQRRKTAYMAYIVIAYIVMASRYLPNGPRWRI